MNDKQKTHDQRVREMAHQIWLVEGRPQGREKEHWELAEAQVAMQEEEERSRAEGKVGRARRPREGELDDELAGTFPASDAPTTTRRESGAGAPPGKKTDGSKSVKKSGS